jgi:hypothetical protein
MDAEMLPTFKKYSVEPVVFSSTYEFTTYNPKLSIKLGKQYIRYGDDVCSICLENIQTNKTGIITKCGHVFHRTCLSKSMTTKNNWFEKYCPYCNSALKIYTLNKVGFQMYNSQHDDYNSLDELENFWKIKDSIYPYNCICCNHTLGTNSYKCRSCKSYCITGYELDNKYEYNIEEDVYANVDE